LFFLSALSIIIIISPSRSILLSLGFSAASISAVFHYSILTIIAALGICVTFHTNFMTSYPILRDLCAILLVD